jgi:hypothetical protein
MAANKSKKHGNPNPVAKFAHHFNRSIRFKDKTKYTRKGRSKGLPFEFLAVYVVLC